MALPLLIAPFARPALIAGAVGAVTGWAAHGDATDAAAQAGTALKWGGLAAGTAVAAWYAYSKWG